MIFFLSISQKLNYLSNNSSFALLSHFLQQVFSNNCSLVSFRCTIIYLSYSVVCSTSTNDLFWVSWGSFITFKLGNGVTMLGKFSFGCVIFSLPEEKILDILSVFENETPVELHGVQNSFVGRMIFLVGEDVIDFFFFEYLFNLPENQSLQVSAQSLYGTFFLLHPMLL